MSISARLIRDALLALSHEFMHLLNKSLALGVFPDEWKRATVTPIPKSGDLSQVSNYRPISLLPLPGKIMEKIIHKQLMGNIEENDIISESQYGLRKERSTIQAVHNLTEDINVAFNKSQITLAVYIDFRKAFDSVQYPILLQKLKSIDVGPVTFKWLESYLKRQITKGNSKWDSFYLSSSHSGSPSGIHPGSTTLYLIRQ